MEGEERNVTGAFDLQGQSPLMLGADAGLATRTNFAFLGDEAAKDVNLLVVNRQMFIGTELADFGTRVVMAFLSLFYVSFVDLFHRILSPQQKNDT
jgi:hypothetical protein